MKFKSFQTQGLLAYPPLLVLFSLIQFACFSGASSSYPPSPAPSRLPSPIPSSAPSPSTAPTVSAHDQIQESILLAQTHWDQSRLQVLIGDRLQAVIGSLLTHQSILSEGGVTITQPILDALRSDAFTLFCHAAEGSDQMISQVSRVEASLQECERHLQEGVIQATGLHQANVLRTWRERILPLIAPEVQKIFLLVYEQELLNPPERIRLPEAQINTLELALQNASAAGARCTPDEWMDAFALEGLEVPSQETLEGRWQTRSIIALNVWLNHLHSGDILRDEIEAIREELIESHQVPADYLLQIFNGNPPDDELGLPYPSPENRRLKTELLMRPELAFGSVVSAYAPLHAQADSLRDQIVALSERHARAPITRESLESLPLAELRIRFAPLNQAEVARLEAEQRAREEARRLAQEAAHSLRTQVATALGGGEITAESLTSVSDEELQERLMIQLRSLSGFESLDPTRQAAWTLRTNRLSLVQLIPQIQHLRNAANHRAQNAALQAQRIEEQRQHLAQLRADVSGALRVEVETLNSLVTEADLRARLTNRLAAHRGIVLVSDSELSRLERSVRPGDRLRAGSIRTLLDMPWFELVRNVSAISE